MKMGKKAEERHEVAEEVLKEAQHVLEVAASGGEFAAFATEDNIKDNHKLLRKRAMEILAGQYENVDVEVITFPNSEYVDLQALPAKKAPTPKAEK
jgi:hypothetical protein